MDEQPLSVRLGQLDVGMPYRFRREMNYQTFGTKRELCAARTGKD